MRILVSFYNDCITCNNKYLNVIRLSEKNLYNKWVTRGIERKGSKNKMYNVKITSKITVECTITDLISKFNKQLP